MKWGVGNVVMGVMDVMNGGTCGKDWIGGKHWRDGEMDGWTSGSCACCNLYPY